MSPLTCILVCPLLAAVALVFVPRQYGFVARFVALAATAVSALLAVKVFLLFPGAEAGADGYRFVQQIPWVESLGISYFVGVDGINVGLVLMSAIVAFAAVCCSWEIKEREKEFYILLLVMTGGVLGAFASLDLFFFFLFHELALVPTFLMIGVWGRGERKNFATFQITLYLSAGALLTLAGLILLCVQSGANTFSIPALTQHLAQHPLPVAAQRLVFPLLLFGFGVLVSLWPFHSWAPPGYGSAPTAAAMLHAGALKKFGLYGLIRVAVPLMPEAAQSWMPILAWLCLGNILWCGFAATRQRDLNLLIGNSSVAHMGFVFLGIASLNLIGVTGAVLVMIAHGFLAALAFGLAGYLYNQTGTLEFRKLGGLLRQLPFTGTALVMAALAGCGLPGFANFAGEVSVFFGAWSNESLRAATVLAVWGALVTGAVYMLRAVRAVLHGPPAGGMANVADAAGAWRKTPYVLLLAALILFGFAPGLLTGRIAPDAERIVKMANPQRGEDPAERRPSEEPQTAALFRGAAPEGAR